MNCMSSGNSCVAHPLCARVGRSCFVVCCKKDAFSLTCTCSVGDEAMPSFQPTASAVCRFLLDGDAKLGEMVHFGISTCREAMREREREKADRERELEGVFIRFQMT